MFLSALLFWSVIGFGALLLFVGIWFESTRKVRSVGVLLGLGASRGWLISAFATQTFTLILLVLCLYSIGDAFGVWRKLVVFSSSGSQDILDYSRWSVEWRVFVIGLLFGVTGLIAALRWRLYGHEPHDLIGTR
jgi:predicted lysophospholipase L1 biosynthesis ABC-type transport system permease subunit